MIHACEYRRWTHAWVSNVYVVRTVSVYEQMYICAYILACVYVCMCVCVYTRLRFSCIHVIAACMYACVCVCVCVCVCKGLYVCMYECAKNKYMYVYKNNLKKWRNLFRTLIASHTNKNARALHAAQWRLRLRLRLSL